MKFYELYVETDIVRGGLWWCPDSSRYIEVVDFEGVGGYEDTCAVVLQGYHIERDDLLEPIKTSGMGGVEEALASFDRWLSVGRFGRLRKKDQENVLRLGLAVHGHYGYPVETIDLVVGSESKTAQEIMEAAGAVSADRVFIVPDARKEVWWLLKEHGIRRASR